MTNASEAVQVDIEPKVWQHVEHLTIDGKGDADYLRKRGVSDEVIAKSRINANSRLGGNLGTFGHDYVTELYVPLLLSPRREFKRRFSPTELFNWVLLHENEHLIQTSEEGWTRVDEEQADTRMKVENDSTPTIIAAGAFTLFATTLEAAYLSKEHASLLFPSAVASAAAVYLAAKRRTRRIWHRHYVMEPSEIRAFEAADDLYKEVELVEVRPIPDVHHRFRAAVNQADDFLLRLLEALENSAG